MKFSINFLIVTLGVVLAAWILGRAVTHRNQSEHTISVTGLGEKEFDSDLIVWSGTFSRRSMELSQAYAELNGDKEKVRNYLTGKGVVADEIVFAAVNLQKDVVNHYNDQGYITGSTFNGYTLTQKVTIQSKEVNKIEAISREVTQLINAGVEFNSQAPQYYYTRLADLKQEMVGAATADARSRAERIADSSHAALGKLKTGKMGIFQITAPNSNEDYSWGGAFNTSSKRKKASITIRLEYQVK